MLMTAYDKLAEELKDKVNIVAVDCDAHRSLCTKNGVKGFPTIKMYVYPQTSLISGWKAVNQTSIQDPDLSTSSSNLPLNQSSRKLNVQLR
jgi:thioredoxin-like negative regulator of GroEL